MNKSIHVYMQPRRYGQTYAELIRLTKENERLNDIINELERWLKEHSVIDYSCSDVILHEQMALNVAFNYLQILKENKHD